MRHPELVKRERDAHRENRRNRYWYRWTGLYLLAMFAVVALMLAVHHEAYAVLLSLVAAMFVTGAVIIDRLAAQRARDECSAQTRAAQSETRDA